MSVLLSEEHPFFNDASIFMRCVRSLVIVSQHLLFVGVELFAKSRLTSILPLVESSFKMPHNHDLQIFKHQVLVVRRLRLNYFSALSHFNHLIIYTVLDLTQFLWRHILVFHRLVQAEVFKSLFEKSHFPFPIVFFKHAIVLDLSDFDWHWLEPVWLLRLLTGFRHFFGVQSQMHDSGSFLRCSDNISGLKRNQRYDRNPANEQLNSCLTFFLFFLGQVNAVRLGLFRFKPYFDPVESS